MNRASVTKQKLASVLVAIGLVLLAACGDEAFEPSATQFGAASVGMHHYYVATTGSDRNPGTAPLPFRTIQHALNVATRPGDTILVRAGTYAEAVSFRADGTAARPIVLENYPGERPSITGAGARGQELVRIFDRSHVRLLGFDVGNLAATSPLDSGAIMIEGYGDDIAIEHNDVHDVVPKAHHYANGRAINVRGFFAGRPITNVTVARNVIERCIVQDGNVLEISGNAANVTVAANRLLDNGGIAINVTGGTQPPRYRRWKLQVRNVIVRDNVVERTRGSGAIGLYVQASDGVLVERNTVTSNAWGIIVDSEYPEVHARNVTLTSNVVRGNLEAGVMLGSPFFPTTVLGLIATRNTVTNNGAGEAGSGGNFGIGHAIGVLVRGNTLVAADRSALLSFGLPFKDVQLASNCYDAAGHNAARAYFGYGATTYVGFAAYRSATHQDAGSSFGAACDSPKQKV
ncbi:MAG: right-handed parallel beta-helix repeat-containing protein [Candidatus Eremiobacteraeota bacterium]|nr:right-handed parallel beta-helix repeat-containing protein [Candidatus Eremiobacteraeota bacterium]